MKYKCEIVDKSGYRKHNITVKVKPSQHIENLDRIKHAIYARIEKGKYKCSESAFWKEWLLLQYYKV